MTWEGDKGSAGELFPEYRSKVFRRTAYVLPGREIRFSASMEKVTGTVDESCELEANEGTSGSSTSPMAISASDGSSSGNAAILYWRSRQYVL